MASEMTFTSSSQKRAFTQDFFSRIARRYELVNVLISLGQVGSWRQYAAEQTRVPPDGRVLDVAAGDGRLSDVLSRQWPSADVIGLDFASEMIRLAQDRTNDEGMQFMEGDALCLPFPDGHFDAAISAFMMRNVVDVGIALREQARVVRAGGRVVCLEMTWPRSPIFRPLFRIYFFGLVPLVGWFVTGQREPYRYLPRSVRAFLSPPRLAEEMRQAGLREVRYRVMAMGTVAVHTGVKGRDGCRPAQPKFDGGD